jgi:outer membrane protein OmpA-like peptidoglycan-associated protein
LEKDKNTKVLVVGFTDNIGNATSNKILGLKRANRVKNILLKNGVAKNRIIVKSEGKDMPIADNSTKKGRQKNRRVEISYIKN